MTSPRHKVRVVDARRFTTDGAGTMRPVNPKPPFKEPAGKMHWRSGARSADGAECGAVGVRFTGREAEVECAKCRRLLSNS